MYIYVLLGSQWSSIHSSDMLSGFDSLYLAELSCVLLLTHLLQLLNQLYFRCSHCLTFQSMFNQLSFFFNRFLGLKITTLLCTVLNRCVFIKCFVFFYFLYLVNWNIKYHLGLQLFEKVEATKPSASRSTSAEIYIICLKYKAPAKIQPELLDIKHLFSVVPEQAKVCWATCLNHLSSFFSFFC